MAGVTRWMMMITLLFAAVACGNDTSGNGNGSTTGHNCASGTTWDPVLAQCTDRTTQSTNNLPTTTNGQNNGSNTNNPSNSNPGTNNTSTTNNTTTTSGMMTNGTNNTTLACGKGTLVGKSCLPTGEPLAAADVTLTGIDCATGMNFTLTTRTASDGTFQFNDVPSGHHTLTVSSGSFMSTRQVVVQDGQTTDLTSAAEKVCLDNTVKIAVIDGAYDHVEDILDKLNLTYDVKGDDDVLGNYDQSATFLKDLNAMQQYDIIFINCGNLFDTMKTEDQFGGTMDLQTVYNNLRSYVQSGKSLYVSDWAGPFVEGAFPDILDFYGDDTDPNASRQGYAPQDITATVETQGLQTVLGQNTATINFPQDPTNNIVNNNWVVVSAVGMNATVQLDGDAKLCGTPSGGGPFADPCPQGTDSQAGAPLLVTYTDPSGGTVVFTSFHNERQATLSQEMEAILRYLIFQL